VSMNGLPAARRRLLDKGASRLPISRRGSCTRVAVDGVDGAGKTTFADELASWISERWGATSYGCRRTTSITFGLFVSSVGATHPKASG